MECDSYTTERGTLGSKKALHMLGSKSSLCPAVPLSILCLPNSLLPLHPSHEQLAGSAAAREIYQKHSRYQTKGQNVGPATFSILPL